MAADSSVPDVLSSLVTSTLCSTSTSRERLGEGTVIDSPPIATPHSPNDVNGATTTRAAEPPASVTPSCRAFSDPIVLASN